MHSVQRKVDNGDVIVKPLVLGALGTNCYMVYRYGETECAVIDPADDASGIMAHVHAAGLKGIGAVLLTHGHYDHIGAADELRKAAGCPIYACAAEKDLLENEDMNLSASFAYPITLQADIYLEDGAEIKVCGLSFHMISSPGHTAGSVCYYIPAEDLLFAGDTLFAGSAGRTDLPTGNTAQLLQSLRQRLAVLPDSTQVLPGHGAATTIAHEKQTNPYL